MKFLPQIWNMTELLKRAYSPESFRKNAHELVDILADHIESCQNKNEPIVLPWTDPNEHYQDWKSFFESGDELSNHEFWNKLVKQSIHLHNPNYMGHQVSAPVPLSGLGDMVNGILNNGSAIYEMGPVVTSMERVVIKWLTKALGFDDNAEGIITSGGSLGNLTALLAARQMQAGYNIWKEGNNLDFHPAIIVSREAHYSVSRAVQILGWGEEAVIYAPVDRGFSLDPASLPQLLDTAKSQGRQVIAVIGNACTTSTGSYDPLDKIADFCEANDIWFHVDGAHGGIAAISPKYQHYTKGINRADSVVIDFHKMMGVSALATVVLFKDPDPSYSNFAQDASYLLDEKEGYEWYNSAKRTIECTKNMTAVKVYAILKQLGPQFFIDYLETCYDNGRSFGRLIRNHKDFELAIEPKTNIVCFRYVNPDLDITGQNEINQKVRNRLIAEGRFYIVQTQIAERLYLRTSLMNPFTSEKEMSDLLNNIIELINLDDE